MVNKVHLPLRKPLVDIFISLFGGQTSSEFIRSVLAFSVFYL